MYERAYPCAATADTRTRALALRIVHVLDTLNVGGAEQFVLRLAVHQKQLGHSVSILGIEGGPIRELAERAGIPVRVVKHTARIPRALEAAGALWGMRPSIVHAHCPYSLRFALYAKILTGARVVLTRHGVVPRRIFPVQWRYTDAVVAVSDAVARMLRASAEALPGKITVVPNGVEALPASRSRRVVRAELGVGEQPVGIIVARVNGEKGHDTLLDAWCQLGTPGQEPVLLVVGDGQERPALEQRALTLGLTGTVRFLGYREDIPDLLGAADFFVLPSLTEGLPLSALEAMSHGLPVIATPVGGTPEVVSEGETGLLVPVNDPAALAAAIRQLSTESQLRSRLGAAGRRRVQTEFSFARMLVRYDDVYARVLNARSDASSAAAAIEER